VRDSEHEHGSIDNNKCIEAGDSKQVYDLILNLKNRINSFYKDYNPPTDQKAMKAMLKLFRMMYLQSFILIFI